MGRPGDRPDAVLRGGPVTTRLPQACEEVVLGEGRAGGVHLSDERLDAEDLGERLVGEAKEEGALELAEVRAERSALLRGVRRRVDVRGDHLVVHAERTW